MARRYDDPVHVRRCDSADHREVNPLEPDPFAEAPTQFLWRGRLYVVREVLAHWIESGTWWRSAAAVSAGMLEPEGPQRDAVEATRGAGAPHASPAADDERELWRVEASAGRVLGIGVFDLSLDRRAGSWSLAQALD